MGTIRLQPPEDYELARDVCSYGYFVLAPNRWIVADRALERVLDLGATHAGGRVVAVRVMQPGGRGSPLRVQTSHTLAAGEKAALRTQLTRMLRLDESAADIAAFHAVDPRFRESGRGRLFRSPTLFEDIIKTVTSCNVTWPGTVQMNRRLCEVLGAGIDGATKDAPRAFPLAGKLARARTGTLRARCRVGYRDQRLVELGRLFSPRGGRPSRTAQVLEDPAITDDDLHEALIELPGVGPYAAANIMQLLGRYGRLPLDSESVRHGRTVLGMSGTSAQVMKRVKEHFAPFGPHAFRSYWFELWEFYEGKQGPAWTWERDRVSSIFAPSAMT